MILVHLKSGSHPTGYCEPKSNRDGSPAKLTLFPSSTTCISCLVRRIDELETRLLKGGRDAL